MDVELDFTGLDRLAQIKPQREGSAPALSETATPELEQIPGTGRLQNEADRQRDAAARSLEICREYQHEQGARRVKETVPMARLNLKIPADIKEYLQAAAYRESSPKKIVSLTEYLCNLVRADMEKHKDN